MMARWLRAETRFGGSEEAVTTKIKVASGALQRLAFTDEQGNSLLEARVVFVRDRLSVLFDHSDETVGKRSIEMRIANGYGLELDKSVLEQEVGPEAPDAFAVFEVNSAPLKSAGVEVRKVTAEDLASVVLGSRWKRAKNVRKCASGHKIAKGARYVIGPSGAKLCEECVRTSDDPIIKSLAK